MTLATNYLHPAEMQQTIDAIRTFNRFYTRFIGALDAHFLGSRVSLSEARLLLEIAGNEPVQASALQAMLGLDRGYLSRMISRFEKHGWVSRDRSGQDGRSRPISLTAEGRALFADIDQRQHDEIAAVLTRLDQAGQQELASALTTARRLLSEAASPAGEARAARNVLDRPVWNALTGRQAALSKGNDVVRCFDPAISPFGAVREDSAQNWDALVALADGAELWVMEKEQAVFPPQIRKVRSAECLQMVARDVPAEDCTLSYCDLGEEDAADMLALARLTAPGPFLPQTYRLGAFVGIRDQGRLVAMAGERLKPGNFTEVSGVCTHPDYRGRGYARFLMRVVARRILARGEQPFLHSYSSNTAAIALYAALGFEPHQTITATVIRKA
ncbi:GNAT family N-acetyltransferase [Acetobacter senegalensis]|uniref:GNAT family N-acetyltransferase n=1 Tax=Acetobacter senegalensis TaxID=446692 RepID=UPI0020A1FDCE|nr:GNAT family N-acetyltransferase [Acetobacter senegalensis]MCP1195775.1 GNAT family N-acetyltransferase [Acetobacter senegalensis]